MDYYSLKADEVVLFEEEIFLENEERKAHLLLTNYNIVIKSFVRKFLREDDVAVDIYSVAEIKNYNDMPQVIQKKEAITVYLLSGEVKFSLPSSFSAGKFVNKITELITGVSTASRDAGKVKNAIGLVDETLGIDMVGAISGVLENGLVKSLFTGFGKNKKKGVQFAASTAKDAAKDLREETKAAKESEPEAEEKEKTAAPEKTMEERVEAVKKLKELVDMGILTETEFESKKKEILGL